MEFWYSYPKKYRNHHESAGHQTAPTAASATAICGHAATVPGVQSPACSAVRLSRLPALRLVALWLAARTDGLTAGRSDRHSPRFKSRSYRPTGRRAAAADGSGRSADLRPAPRVTPSAVDMPEDPA